MIRAIIILVCAAAFSVPGQIVPSDNASRRIDCYLGHVGHYRLDGRSNMLWIVRWNETNAIPTEADLPTQETADAWWADRSEPKEVKSARTVAHAFAAIIDNAQTNITPTAWTAAQRQEIADIKAILIDLARESRRAARIQARENNP